MVYVVAEVGQCHEGHVGKALHMVRAFADAGCSGIKFQTLTPDLIASKLAVPYWDTPTFGAATQAEAFARAGTINSASEWATIVEECHECGVDFITTPFDLRAVELLDPLVDRWKIASGDITNKRLIKAVAETGKPIILSTGASTPNEIGRAVQWIEGAYEDEGELPQLTLLACSLQYPTPTAHAELWRITELRQYGYPVGYSDHTIGTQTALAAAALGAEVLEKHATWVEITGGGGPVPDHAMGLPPYPMNRYVTQAEEGARLLGHGGWVHEGEGPARIQARRSLFAARHIDAGHRLTGDDVIELRPGEVGIGPEEIDRVLGTVAVKQISRGQPLQWEMLA